MRLCNDFLLTESTGSECIVVLPLLIVDEMRIVLPEETVRCGNDGVRIDYEPTTKMSSIHIGFDGNHPREFGGAGIFTGQDFTRFGKNTATGFKLDWV